MSHNRHRFVHIGTDVLNVANPTVARHFPKKPECSNTYRRLENDAWTLQVCVPRDEVNTGEGAGHVRELGAEIDGRQEVLGLLDADLTAHRLQVHHRL